MDNKYSPNVLPDADNDVSMPISAMSPSGTYETDLVDDEVTRPVSKVTPEIWITLGTEEPELLESLISEKTNEEAKADKEWSLLRGTRSIDTSVVAGFVLQINDGTDCTITMSENGNRPVQTLIDSSNEFALYLVIVLRHERWTTSGTFSLRFLRRVPVLAKRCTVRMDTPLAETYIEEPKPASADLTDNEEQVKQETADRIESSWEHVKQETADWAEGTMKVIQSDLPRRGIFTVIDNVLARVLGRANQSEQSEHEDTTIEEDWRATGASPKRKRDASTE